MIKKTEKILITFFTTTAAMNMESVCKSVNADGRIIPVPGFISAGCGLGWCAAPESEEELTKIMQEHSIDYQAVHRCVI